MKKLNELKLSLKLLLMLLLPILVLLGTSVDKDLEAYNIRKANIELKTFIEFSVHIGALVHTMQSERGATAIFLSSKGTKYNSELQALRLKTDQNITSLKAFLLNFDPSRANKSFVVELNRSIDYIDRLASSRSAIDSLNMSLADALKFYTNNNSSWLGLISSMATISVNADMAIMSNAYVNFLQNKERAGIERAVLASVFTRDEFGADYAKYLSLKNAQDTYIKVFVSLANQESLDFFQRTMSGKFIDETSRIRAIAEDKATVGEFGIEPAYWFEMQTGKINLEKQVEDFLAIKLEEKAILLIDEATLTLIYSLIIAVVSLLATAFVAYYIGQGILRQLGGEPGEIETLANQIAKGNLDLKLKQSGGKLVGVYKAMVSMQEKLTSVIESDIQLIIDKAKVGDLSQRIQLDDKEGFYERLSSGINELVDVNERVIDDTVRMFSAMSSGDLSQAIDNEYQGAFEQLKQDANRTVMKLTQVIEGDIQKLVNQARKGDLTQRISLDDKDGFFKNLSLGVNELVAVSEQVVNDTVRVFGALANGDLTKTITEDYQGSFGELKNDANATVNKLTEIISEIRSSASSVASGASEISSGNMDLSQRTEEQASSLEETAASMEEMTSTVRQNADNAKNASVLASEAQEKAESGGAVVGRAIDAMSEINKSSSKIADIIGVIDEIAFQTNLLALNAAVEAARAGEQGRGFAVVAAEVRNLAQRSAGAAKEIKTLIRDSVEKVESGSNLVNESGGTLDEIVQAVKLLNEMIVEISTSSQEQTEGIEQVNSAISQMDEVTQQNAALVEEASAASENMAEQAGLMNELTAFFNTDSDEGVAKLFTPDSPLMTDGYVEQPSRNAKDNKNLKMADAESWEEF